MRIYYDYARKLNIGYTSTPHGVIDINNVSDFNSGTKFPKNFEITNRTFGKGYPPQEHPAPCIDITNPNKTLSHLDTNKPFAK